MTKTVEFIFDFVSPNGYLAWWPLKEIAARKGATITITPVLRPADALSSATGCHVNGIWPEVAADYLRSLPDEASAPSAPSAP